MRADLPRSWGSALILRCRFNMRDCTFVPLLRQGSPPMTIQEAVNKAVEGGLVPMLQDALIKAGQGITTLQEVMRTVAIL